MSKIFTKTFVSFSLKFVGIIALSLILLSIISAYASANDINLPALILKAFTR